MSDIEVVDAGAATQQEAPPSFDDTLNAEIDKVFDAADQIEAGGQVQGAERGPDGKFVARNPEAGKLAEGQTQQQVVEDQEVPDPPESWSSVAAHWKTLTPEVRQALIDRDAADQQSRTETGERLKTYADLERIVGPRAAALTQTFGSPSVALEQLFALSDMAGRDFPGFVRHLAQQRGIDIQSLVQQVAAQPSTDPTIAALTGKIGQLESKLSEREQAENQAKEREAADVIKTFRDQKSDKGDALHPHFDAVSKQIGQLLSSGAATTLEQAYKIAVATDDKLQAKIAVDATKAQKAKEEADAKEKASKARGIVHADIRSSSGSSRPARQTLDDTLRAAIDRALPN
jgi:hypothetical protein